jgi:DUF2950 family protein
MTRTLRVLTAPVLACLAVLACGSCSRTPPEPAQRTFAAPQDAVRALSEAVSKQDVAEVVKIFGPDGQGLVDSSDAATARRNREVFAAAFAEGWRLVDGEDGKSLIIGNEGWPFPVPLVEDKGGWRFDTAAGKEEVLDRRIGRNELAVIQICRRYVVAQRLYARHGHDGKRAGIYARTFRSDPGRHNGLYWADTRGETLSPLGELIMEAAAERGRPDADRRQPAPFHGYHFRILTAQGDAAGGATSYVVNGEMSGGFALVAWPATYDATGIMTFIVNQDGILHEKDLGPETERVAQRMTLYDPDGSWTVQ